MRPSLKDLQKERQEQLAKLDLQKKYAQKNIKEVDHDFLIDKLKLIFTFL